MLSSNNKKLQNRPKTRRERKKYKKGAFLLFKVVNMEWKRGRTIGCGSSASVSLATSTQSGEVFAVKSAELSKSELLRREAEILSALSSPHIIAYRGYEITEEPNKVSTFNIVMEYACNGTLTDITRRHGGRLDEPTIVEYTRQILQGLEYIHSQGIVHCDIKGSNILIGGDERAKIADFGCAKRVENRGSDRTEAEPMRGTPAYMAPEVARGEFQGFESDIWALGCTIIEMATGLPPWFDMGQISDPVSVLYRVAYSGELPEIPRFLGPQASDFLDKCLRRDLKERWRASQLLKHPFLVEFGYRNRSLTEKLDYSRSISPTSVVDQRFWTSVDGESESLENLVHSGCNGSPKERIQRLWLISSWALWGWDDESWITIRDQVF